ncbi:MAG: DNA replication and repair protein RecF [Alphaproteobacteria bacterium]|nr:DNA replication and repair protein RecF [Alphaproteobacteria bacterium]
MPPSAPRIDHLRLVQFRSHALFEMETDTASLVLVEGANGTGKTNILEALSLFGFGGRGFRNAATMELHREGQAAPWGVAVTLDETRYTLMEAPGDTRVFKIDDSIQKSTPSFGEAAALLWLTPRHDRLFDSSAGDRRRFFDRFVSAFYAGHSGHLRAYDYRWRERRALFESGGAVDATWRRVIEQSLAGHAVAIAAARNAVLAQLQRWLAEPLADFPPASLALLGWVEQRCGELPAVLVEQELLERLERGALEGVLLPHQADVTALHLGKNAPAHRCSSGEQKAVVMAWLLAEARLLAAEQERAPILLLDEPFTHLDVTRQGALLEALLALGCQVWLTDCGTLSAPLPAATKRLKLAA